MNYSVFPALTSVPSPTGMMMMGSGKCLNTEWLVLLEKNPEFREHIAFTMDGKHACLPFAPEGDTVSSKAIHYTNILEKNLEQKTVLLLSRHEDT